MEMTTQRFHLALLLITMAVLPLLNIVDQKVLDRKEEAGMIQGIETSKTEARHDAPKMPMGHKTFVHCPCACGACHH